MQPYFFPYIGYFQLINAVDRFVILDDVNFIKRGWINRNRILIGGTEKLISIPCVKASQNKLINEIGLSLDQRTKAKLIKTIYNAYHKAPFFRTVFHLIEQTIVTEVQNIGELAVKSIKEVCNYLGINTKVIPTATVYHNSHLKKADRIIDICKIEGFREYLNPIGGSEIYSKVYFKEQDINLYFIKPKHIEYKQFNNNFVHWLSIIDVLMFNKKNDVILFLEQYDLI